MTQELAIWVLIAGLIGLVWVLTCAILTQDRPSQEPAAEAADTAKADQPESRRIVAQRVAA